MSSQVCLTVNIHRFKRNLIKILALVLYPEKVPPLELPSPTVGANPVQEPSGPDAEGCSGVAQRHQRNHHGEKHAAGKHAKNTRDTIRREDSKVGGQEQ